MNGKEIMEKKHLLLTIEYDGTCFSGWQRQPGRRTVQGELERVLSVLCGNAISIDGTGRTDAGVHALGQCATFSAEFGIPVDRLMRAANDMLVKGRRCENYVGPGGRRRFSRPVQRGRKALYLSDFLRRADVRFSEKLSVSRQAAAGYGRYGVGIKSI